MSKTMLKGGGDPKIHKRLYDYLKWT